MENGCPFHLVGTARDLVKRSLGPPRKVHANSLIFLNGEKLTDMILSFSIPEGLSKNKQTSANVYVEKADSSSGSFFISALGIALFAHILTKIPEINIQGSTFIVPNEEVLLTISLLYQAVQPIDLVLSNACESDISSPAWISQIKRNLKQLATLPDGVQSAITNHISGLRLLIENIIGLSYGRGLQSVDKIRLYDIKEEILILRHGGYPDYGVCPALLDGSLEEVFDLLVPIYKSHYYK